jgi:hypothetical protein
VIAERKSSGKEIVLSSILRHGRGSIGKWCLQRKNEGGCSIAHPVSPCIMNILWNTSSSAYLHTHHYIVESPPMGLKTLITFFGERNLSTESR